MYNSINKTKDKIRSVLYTLSTYLNKQYKVSIKFVCNVGKEIQR